MVLIEGIPDKVREIPPTPSLFLHNCDVSRNFSPCFRLLCLQANLTDPREYSIAKQHGEGDAVGLRKAVQAINGDSSANEIPTEGSISWDKFKGVINRTKIPVLFRTSRSVLR